MIRGLPLKVELIRALPLALLALAAICLAIAGPPAPVEQPATVGSIDLDALHRQAATALEALRSSRDRPRQIVAAKIF